MKKILVFLVALLVLIQIASAQMQVSHISPTVQKVKPMTTQTLCKEEAELWNDMEACKQQGMSYEVYIDQNRCKQIRCIERQQTRECPSEKELESNILACKRKNLDYEYYADNYGCRQVKCIQQEIVCPAEHEIEQRRLKCKADGKSYEYYTDDRGCKQIRCLEKTCPTKEQLEERERKCKELGLEPYYYTNDMGCRMIDCKEKPQEPVMCKKIIEGNCAVIRCEDGYMFNSCTFCTTREPVKKEEKMPVEETAPDVKKLQPVRLEPGRIVSTVRKCVNDMKDERTQIDDEVVWNRCKNKYEQAMYDFDAVRACIEDNKGDAAIDDEVVWNRCKTQYPGLAGSMEVTQACIADAKKGYAEIDDEVVWSKCQMQAKETTGAMNAVQKCVQDIKKSDVLIDDEVVWSKCSEAYSQGKLSPQPDPPGISPGVQPAQNQEGVLNAIGNFFRGIFK